jgi:hypothetical protein
MWLNLAKSVAAAVAAAAAVVVNSAAVGRATSCNAFQEQGVGQTSLAPFFGKWALSNSLREPLSVRSRKKE